MTHHSTATLRTHLRRMLIGIACLLTAASSAASGGAGVTVAGFERRTETSLTQASVQLQEHLDLNGDGTIESRWRAEADAYWSMTAGLLNLGGRVMIAGRDLPIHPAGHFAHAAVTFVDKVRVTTAGLPVGAPLTVQLAFDVSGTPSNPWPGFDTSFVPPPNWLAPHGGASAVLFADGVSGSFVSSGLHSDDFMFQPEVAVLNDVPFDITLQLYIELRGPWALAQSLDYPSLYGGYSTSGELDFMHTLKYAGLSAQDMRGGALGDATLWSSSGVAYVAAASPVPEPSSTALLLCGLVACGWLRHRGLHADRRERRCER